MFLSHIILKKAVLTVCCLLTGFALLAENTPVVKTVAQGTNLLATLLIITAVVLIFVIYGMGQVLITFSRQLLDKNKTASKIPALGVLALLVLFSQNGLAQDPVTKEVVNSIPNYGGLSANTFYFLVAAVCTEVITIFFLFFSIRRIYTELIPEKAIVAVKASALAALWVKLDKRLFTKAIPVEKEADALLDHNYDGIQELDNALPPWWKYGFIITIGVAIIYLLNFHVLGSGKNPTEEYLAEMKNAAIEKEIFEAKNIDKIDETNVPMANALGIQKGKAFYTANCVACHGSMGEGGAGPNLTDDYWLHKGSLNDIYNTIKKGYPDKGMQSWAIKFNPKEMSEMASYVLTLKGTNPPGGKAAQGELFIATTTTDSLKIAKPAHQLAVK